MDEETKIAVLQTQMQELKDDIRNLYRVKENLPCVTHGERIAEIKAQSAMISAIIFMLLKILLG